MIPINAKTLGVFKVAYFREFGNRVATQGQSIIMSVTPLPVVRILLAPAQTRSAGRRELSHIHWETFRSHFMQKGIRFIC